MLPGFDFNSGYGSNLYSYTDCNGGGCICCVFLQ